MKRLLCLTILIWMINIGCSNMTADLPASETVTSTLRVTPTQFVPTVTTTSSVLLSMDLIAFVTVQNQSKSIAIMTSNGQNVRVLTDAIGEDHHPQWSPNGTKIAFLSNRALFVESDNRDLWLVDITTQQLTQLTYDGKLHKLSSFEWSPDGDRILYSQTEGPVNVVDLTNKISQPLGEHFHAPLAWSPNGQWIAVEEAVQIDSNAGIPGRFLAILDLRDNNIVRSDFTLNTATSLDWSPNSDRLAVGTFFSNRGDGDLTVVSVREEEVTLEVNLAESLELVREENVSDVSWSPNGKMLAFRVTTSELLTQRLPKVGFIYISDSSFIQVWVITPEELLCNRPQWSFDSTKLIFACIDDEKENADIWMVSKDGSDLEQLTDTPTFEGEPVWQPKR